MNVEKSWNDLRAKALAAEANAARKPRRPNKNDRRRQAIRDETAAAFDAFEVLEVPDRTAEVADRLGLPTPAR